MTEPEPWRCPCGYWPPTESMRDQHFKTCPAAPRPKETRK